MFGDGSTHGRPVSSKYIAARPAVHRHDVDRGVDAEVIVEEPRQLADRHAVPHRDRELADERRVRRVERRALDGVAADRIRPIAHDDADAVPAGGAQAVGHRVDVGVDARADVLEIDDQHVDVGEHLARSARASRCRANAPARAASRRRVRRLDHVLLQVRAEAVLRAEHRRQRPVAGRGEAIRGVPEPASIEAGLQTRPTRWPAIRLSIRAVEQAIESEAYRASADYKSALRIARRSRAVCIR